MLEMYLKENCDVKMNETKRTKKKKRRTIDFCEDRNVGHTNAEK